MGTCESNLCNTLNWCFVENKFFIKKKNCEGKISNKV